MGNKVDDSGTSQRFYWKIINRVMNKCSPPKIPPILINNQFILNCNEKAKHFNNFFSEQCKLIINSSVLPNLSLLTDRKIDHITIDNDEIISLIRNLDPNKVTGSDGISGHGIWAYGIVVSMFDFHRSDRGSNPGRGGKIS